MAYIADPTKPMFSTLKYCVRCGLPSSEEMMTFDDMGVCRACRSSEMKMRINWAKREKKLHAIFDRFRGQGDYDCICPISGGKDSAFQLYLLKEVYKIRPLAVTHSHNWWSETGWKNLQRSLETFDVDHIMFTPSRGLVNRMARRSLEMIGDSCWHCHAGVIAFPYQIAVKFRIPLMVWGESASEGTGKADYDNPPKYDRESQYAESARIKVDEFATPNLSVRELSPYKMPSWDDINDVGLFQLHLGDYIFWDGERQTEFLRERYGWLEDKVEGTYKCYKSVECRMPGMHDFTKFLKRGCGRSTEHVNQDVRAGVLTLEEGYELMRDIDPVEPEILDYYLHITGYSREEFYAIMNRQREKLGYLTGEEIQAALNDAHRRKGDVELSRRQREAIK